MRFEQFGGSAEFERCGEFNEVVVGCRTQRLGGSCPTEMVTAR
jgi:hypothetical protein